MPDCKQLLSILKLTSLLAVLALMLVAPIPLAGFVTVSSRPDCLHSDFTLPPGQPTASLGATTATHAVWKMKALPSENEEEEGADALDESRVSFLNLASSRKVLDRQLITRHSILSLYPLRC
jgi:hypothetical protein